MQEKRVRFQWWMAAALGIAGCAGEVHTKVMTQSDEHVVNGPLTPERMSREQAGLLAERTKDLLPEQVFALETTFPGGGPGHTTEVRCWHDHGEVRWKEPGGWQGEPNQYFVRRVNAGELGAFEKAIRQVNADHVRPGESKTFDGVAYRYTHVDGAGMQAVYMDNPEDQENNALEMAIVNAFAGIEKPDDMKLVYRHPLPEGVELVYAHPLMWAKQVWASGKDVRVALGHAALSDDTWHQWKDGRMGAEVDPPEFFKQMAWAPKVMTSPDGKWSVTQEGGRVVARQGKTGREQPMDPAVAWQYEPYHLRADGKLWVIRYPGTAYGPGDKDRPDLKLMDVSTGNAVAGVHADTWAAAARPDGYPLEPVEGRPGWVWGTLTETRSNSTHVLQINEEEMQSAGLNGCVFDGMQFNAHHMWVDVPGRVMYFVSGGALFRRAMPQGVLNPSSQDATLR